MTDVSKWIVERLADWRWATRRRLLTETELAAGLTHHLAAADHADLRRQMREQAVREAAVGNSRMSRYRATARRSVSAMSGQERAREGR